MYKNEWEWYKKNYLITFFKMMPQLNLNLMYTKVIERMSNI